MPESIPAGSPPVAENRRRELLQGTPRKPGATPEMQATPPVPAWPGAHPNEGGVELGADEVHVWWMALATPAWPHEELASWLDTGERTRAARFHLDVHRSRYIAAHGQMRALLGAYLGIAPEGLTFTREERGKPRLAAAPAIETAAPDLGFNLSHSDEQGLLAIARTMTLGADIEVQRHLPDLEALARSRFTPSELQDLHALPESRRHDGFFAAWTRKEAYVKALGTGLSEPLDGFEVALHPDAPAGLRSIWGSEESARNWTLWAGRPTASSWAAVAVRFGAARVRTFSLRREVGAPESAPATTIDARVGGSADGQDRTANRDQLRQLGP